MWGIGGCASGGDAAVASSDTADGAIRPWVSGNGSGTSGDSGLLPEDDLGDAGEGEVGASHSFTRYSGQETRWVAYAEDRPGDYTCILIWTAEGRPNNPMSVECEGCAFAFEVELTFQADESELSSACTVYAGNLVQTYAFSPDYYGAGEGALLYQYWDSYYARGAATFDDGVFTYGGGYLDYYYEGGGYYPQYAETWFTNYRFGSAAVE